MTSKKTRLLVSAWTPKRKCDEDASIKGQEILSGETGSILVKHKRKKWCMLELLQHLAARVDELEGKQCIPSIKCLFEGQKYVDDKYIRKAKYEPPALYDE